MNKVVLENEQLKLEVNEMKAKLKEKRETEEFEMLEKQTQKEHEVRCTEIQIDKNSVYSIFFWRVKSVYIYLDVYHRWC